VLVAVGMLAGLNALGAGNSSSWSSTSNKITNAMKNRALTLIHRWPDPTLHRPKRLG
jgi:hypothetical protein